MQDDDKTHQCRSLCSSEVVALSWPSSSFSLHSECVSMGRVSMSHGEESAWGGNVDNVGADQAVCARLCDVWGVLGSRLTCRTESAWVVTWVQIKLCSCGGWGCLSSWLTSHSQCTRSKAVRAFCRHLVCPQRPKGRRMSPKGRPHSSTQLVSRPGLGYWPWSGQRRYRCW